MKKYEKPQLITYLNGKIYSNGDRVVSDCVPSCGGGSGNVNCVKGLNAQGECAKGLGN